MTSRFLKVSYIVAYFLGYSTTTFQLSLFSGCHFKLFTLSTISDISTKSLVDLYIQIFRNQELVTSQITIFVEKSKNSSKKKSRIDFGIRYSPLFVHVYAEDLISKNGHNYTHLEKLMNDLQSRDEWPHHTIFIGSFDKYSDKQRSNQLNFYRQGLPHTFARGILLSFDSETLKIFLICIRCRLSLHEVDKQVDNKTSIENLQKTLEKRGHRGIRVEIQDHLKHESERGCDIASPNLRPVYNYRYRAVCAMYVIRDNLNLTYVGRRDRNKAKNLPGFSANLGTPGGMRNVQSRSVIPYGSRSHPLNFVAFQLRPRLSADDLLDSYDWISWSLFLLGMLIILLVALIFEKYSIPEMIYLEMSLFTAFLEQPLPFKGGKNSPRKIVVICWLLWVFMMVVFSTGYKAALFSFLTKLAGLYWPRNLKELVTDSSYLLWNNERSYGGGGTYRVQSYLVTFFSNLNVSGIPGKDFPEEYFLLNNSIVHVDLNETADIASNFIGRSRMDDEFERYQIDGVWTEKFAWLARLPIEFTAPVSYFLDDELVMSEPVEIPGFERIISWSGSENFFLREFHSALGGLAQGGFFEAFEKHRDIWFSCNSILDVRIKLNLRFNMHNSEKLRKSSGCLNKMISGTWKHGGNGVDVHAISMEQVMGILQMGMMGLIAASAMFVQEVVRGKGGNTVLIAFKNLLRLRQFKFIPSFY